MNSSKLQYFEEKLCLERLIIGLEEPILVKGLGSIVARVDSGNGGFNVIHGIPIEQSGDVLRFLTVDDNGNEKQLSKRVVEYIDINIGSGNIEHRPVVELDVKFAGKNYKKIKFSLCDRSKNSNKILISKGFIENELDALIDVAQSCISNDNVQAEIVSEANGIISKAFNAGKGVASGLSSGLDKIHNASKDFAQGKSFGGLEKIPGVALGTAAGVAAGSALAITGLAKLFVDGIKLVAKLGIPAVITVAGLAISTAVFLGKAGFKQLKNFWKGSMWLFGHYPAISQNDPTLIKNTLNADGDFLKTLGEHNTPNISVAIGSDGKVSNAKLQSCKSYPIFSYLGMKGTSSDARGGFNKTVVKGQENRVERFKVLAKAVKDIGGGGPNQLKTTSQGVEESEESLLESIESQYMILEDSFPTTVDMGNNASATTTTNASPSTTSQSTTEQQTQSNAAPQQPDKELLDMPDGAIVPDDTQIKNSQDILKEMNDMNQAITARNNFVFYFVSLGSRGTAKSRINDVIRLSADCDAEMNEVLESTRFSDKNFEKVALACKNKISKGFGTDNSEAGFFAICYGSQDKRKCSLIKTENTILYPSSDEEKDKELSSITNLQYRLGLKNSGYQDIKGLSNDTKNKVYSNIIDILKK